MNQDNIKDTEQAIDTNTIELLKKLRKSDTLQCNELLIKEGKTSPPKDIIQVHLFLPWKVQDS